MVLLPPRKAQNRSSVGHATPVLAPGQKPEPGFLHPQDYAAVYDSRTPAGQFFNERLEYVVRHLCTLGGGRLLDVGCGPGILLKRLAGSGFDLFGIDLSVEMIREAKANTASQNVDLKVGQVEHLPYSDQYFDIVLALGVLEYVSDLTVALTELARVSKPNATVIVSMLNRDSAYWFARQQVHRMRARLSSSTSPPRRRVGQSVAIYDRTRLTEAMRQRGIRPNRTFYYGANVCVEPLSSSCPRLSLRINNILRVAPGWLLGRWVYTAFLIIASVVLDMQ